MKQTILILIAFLMLSSCERKQLEVEIKDSKPFGVRMYNGKGWNACSSTLYCDSFQMLSNKSAIVWVNGIKQVVLTENGISVFTNN